MGRGDDSSGTGAYFVSEGKHVPLIASRMSLGVLKMRLRRPARKSLIYKDILLPKCPQTYSGRRNQFGSGRSPQKKSGFF
jgi:hypothetical protein